MLSARRRQAELVPTLSTGEHYSSAVLEPFAFTLDMLMFTWRQHIKVLGAVIVLFPVLVMNMFALGKTATNHLFSYKSMFKDVSIFAGIRMVGRFDNRIAFFSRYMPATPAPIGFHGPSSFRNVFRGVFEATILMARKISFRPFAFRVAVGRLVSQFSAPTRTWNLTGASLNRCGGHIYVSLFSTFFRTGSGDHSNIRNQHLFFANSTINSRHGGLLWTGV